MVLGLHRRYMTVCTVMASHAVYKSRRSYSWAPAVHDSRGMLHCLVGSISIPDKNRMGEVLLVPVGRGPRSSELCFVISVDYVISHPQMHDLYCTSQVQARVSKKLLKHLPSHKASITGAGTAIR